MPLPSAFLKTVPTDYEVEAIHFTDVSGEASTKDGKAQFVGAVPDRVYALVKDPDVQPEEGKPHPFATLSEAIKDASLKIQVSGKVTETKKDDKTVLTVAVSSWRKIEPKKETNGKP